MRGRETRTLSLEVFNGCLFPNAGGRETPMNQSAITVPAFAPCDRLPLFEFAARLEHCSFEALIRVIHDPFRRERMHSHQKTLRMLSFVHRCYG